VQHKVQHGSGPPSAGQTSPPATLHGTSAHGGPCRRRAWVKGKPRGGVLTQQRQRPAAGMLQRVTYRDYQLEQRLVCVATRGSTAELSVCALPGVCLTLEFRRRGIHGAWRARNDCGRAFLWTCAAESPWCKMRLALPTTLHSQLIQRITGDLWADTACRGLQWVKPVHNRAMVTCCLIPRGSSMMVLHLLRQTFTILTRTIV
jgi:hypothetical protein